MRKGASSPGLDARRCYRPRPRGRRPCDTTRGPRRLTRTNSVRVPTTKTTTKTTTMMMMMTMMTMMMMIRLRPTRITPTPTCPRTKVSSRRATKPPSARFSTSPPNPWVPRATRSASGRRSTRTAGGRSRGPGRAEGTRRTRSPRRGAPVDPHRAPSRTGPSCRFEQTTWNGFVRCARSSSATRLVPCTSTCGAFGGRKRPPPPLLAPGCPRSARGCSEGRMRCSSRRMRSRRRCCASSGETSGSCRRASRWTCCASRSGAWSFRCPGTPAPVTRTTRLWILHPTTLIRPTPTLSLTSLELSADAGVESPAGARDEVRVAPLADHLMTTR
mmetsp:Transcript_12120/g.48646  ORF Transcript_12120/g.48646 Transcript_12120/m.48646 type:complete len:330 (-) Transcript_12120:1657-2646(-)